MLTVLGSAVGPLLLAQCHAWTDSYRFVFHSLGCVVIVLSITALLVRRPSKPVLDARAAAAAAAAGDRPPSVTDAG
jgi:hypothetical protein